MTRYAIRYECTACPDNCGVSVIKASDAEFALELWYERTIEDGWRPTACIPMRDNETRPSPHDHRFRRARSQCVGWPATE